MSETVRFGGWIVPNVLCIRDSDGAFHCYILVSGCSLVEKTIIGFSGVLDVIYILYKKFGDPTRIMVTILSYFLILDAKDPLRSLEAML